MSPDVAASIKAHLLADAKARGEEFERTLARFAAERLLFRLGASAAGERCLLKGASLLAVWMRDPYRATRDVDLLAFGIEDEESVRALLAEICAVPCPEDGLSFDLAALRIEAIRAEEEYAGRRARFLSHLGKARIPVQLDLGIGDALAVAPEVVEFPTILDHLPVPRLRAYPREISVAEKLEAMVRFDTQNSRMKDFHDLWALSGAFSFDGPRLRAAVAACFERRGTPWSAETPRPLTPAFYQRSELALRWVGYLAAGAVLTPPPQRFEEIGERIVRFLGPVRESIVAGGPFDREWPAGGPWRAAASGSEGAEGDA